MSEDISDSSDSDDNNNNNNNGNAYDKLLASFVNDKNVNMNKNILNKKRILELESKGDQDAIDQIYINNIKKQRINDKNITNKNDTIESTLHNKKKNKVVDEDEDNDNDALDNDDVLDDDNNDDNDSDSDDYNNNNNNNNNLNAKNSFQLHFEETIDESIMNKYIKECDDRRKRQSFQLVSNTCIHRGTDQNIRVYCDAHINKDLLMTSNKKIWQLNEFNLHPKLIETFKKVSKVGKNKNHLTLLQEQLLPLISNYTDIWYGGRNYKHETALRNMYVLHCINHVLRTRTAVLRNNRKLNLQKRGIKEQMIDNDNDNDDDDIENDEKLNDNDNELEIRDQGFTRPKILVLLPMRNSAYQFVDTLLKLLPEKNRNQILNLKRFKNEYGGHEFKEADEIAKTKGEDFHSTFHGNIDDHFRFGIAFTNKSVKLYAPFYSCDIIVASSLGLRTLVGAEDERDREYDFLSSIEILILDQAEIFSYQNWEHIEIIMNMINQKPVKSGDIDFWRVRDWTLNGWSKYYRQTLIFSSFANVDINAYFNRYCFNYNGRIKYRPLYDGVIKQVIVQQPQVFQRIECDNIVDLPNKRFEYFIKNILPTLKNEAKNHKMAGIIIFVPSYFDYVRLRNYLDSKHIKLCLCCEYSKNSEISRSRGNFFNGRSDMMLMTERFHFYRRYRIRGVRTIIFYSLPEKPEIYTQLINNTEADRRRSLALFSRFEALELERIIGSGERCGKMLVSDKTTYTFH